MRTPGFLTSIYHFIFSSRVMSPVWTVARVYLGYEWAIAGYHKVLNSVWVGSTAGGAITGFVNEALGKTVGEHPDVSVWYAWFLQHAVLPHANTWSHAIAYGEVLVGIGLILGAFTFLAAFFGAFMNVNYLLAGTVSSNPVMLVLAILIMLAHRIAGYIGLDYYILKTGR
ncbi:MAG: DoxX family protein [Parcubacteria group bacterium Gr01-1014_46]|nr:MAG: DoxX family protein [Parcubacteria group bacterium Gr01-1014_46]